MRILVEQVAAADGSAWSFHLGLPDDALDRAVVQYWEVRGVMGHRRETVLPMGDVAVMVNLGSVQGLVDPDDETTVTEFRDAWVSGLHRRRLITDSPGESWLCGVRLTPEGAYRLLGENPAGLADQVVTLESIFHGAAERLTDRMRSAPDAAARFDIMDGLIRRRLSQAPEWDRQVRWAVDALNASSGGVPVAALAEEIGWTRQRLHQRFLDQVGLAPKVFARVLRFGETVRAMEAAAGVSLTAVAHAAGYHDQAHFNRDFRDFAGLTPRQYLARRVEGSESGFARVD